MVAVAPEDELSELVSTPDVLVLTKEPAATSVHDDRFVTMLTKLCRSRQSDAFYNARSPRASPRGSSVSSQRPASTARHIAVGHASGEVLATSVSFIKGARKQLGLVGMLPVGSNDSQADWANSDDVTLLGPGTLQPSLLEASSLRHLIGVAWLCCRLWTYKEGEHSDWHRLPHEPHPQAAV